MPKSLAEKLTERELITVNENDQLLYAINKLVKYNIGAIPVINNNKKLAGIISERDIVKALLNYKNKDYSILLVNQLMTKTVISCEKEVLSDKLALGAAIGRPNEVINFLPNEAYLYNEKALILSELGRHIESINSFTVGLLLINPATIPHDHAPESMSPFCITFGYTPATSSAIS